MKMKYNPWVSLLALLLLAILVVSILAGCRVEASAARNEPPARFNITQVADNEDYFYTFIFTDTETGQQYLYTEHGTGDRKSGGLCLLEE